MDYPKCESKENVKSGYSFKVKFQAAKLYLEDMGFRSIGRILGVSNVSIINWIREFGPLTKAYVETKLPKNIDDVEVVEIDEMWHFTKKKKGSSGYGLQSTDSIKRCLDFQWEVVVKRPSRR